MRTTEEENKENEDFVNIPTSFDGLWKIKDGTAQKGITTGLKNFISYYCNSRERIWYT